MIKPEGGDESAKSHEEWGGSGIASTASGAQWGQLREDGVVAADGQTDAQVSVGRYVLRGELGRGGMGQVLVAWDALLGRTVALKRVLPERQNRAQSAARLAREARITSVLEHPAIVPVLDAGYDDTGEPFYVMRLIRGRTLTEASLNAPGLTGRLSLLRHFLQACEAVAFAHRAGVVHRDLKPDNVLVGEFGETQVADWGLARWIDGKPPSPSGELIPAERSGPDSPERDPQMTAEDIDERGGVTAVGTILGTPAYMSPEQALGQTVGPSGDVYSLGVMLWHLVAGHSPFAGRSASDALALAADGVLPSLRGTCAAAPAELAAIVEHATMPRREDRYPDARALAADVARYLDGRRVRAHAYSPQEHLRRIVRAWRAPLIVAAVAVVLLVIVAGVQYRRTSLERDRAVTAEQSASKARRSSDESLASSLSQHALAAMALGQRDLAETFAIEALVRAESPDARGVLAAFAHAPAATHLPSLPLPRCRKARVVGDYLVCLAGHRASLWQWSDGAYHRRWQRRLDNVRDAAVFERAGKVVLLSERQFVADLASGALQRAGGLAIAPVKVETSSIGSEALASDALVALMLTPDGADATVPLRCPHGGVFGAATKSTGRRAALICGRAGELVVATLPHAIERTIPTSVSVHHGATAAVWLPGAVTLLVGTRDGTLLQVDTNTGDELELGRLPGGQIDRLLLGPNGERVAIETARGPVMIWHSAGRTVLTRIPSTRPLALAWRNSGTELWMYGDRLERWRLPAAAKAIRMWSRNGRPGLGNAVLSPNGRTVALAPGSGQLQLLDAASGARIYSHQFNSAVLKGVSWHADDRLLAWSAAAPGLRVYTGAPWRPERARGRFGIKRALWLSRDRLIYAPFADGLYIASASDHTRRPQPLPTAAGKAAGVFVDADAPDSGAWALLVHSDGGLWNLDGTPDMPVARRLQDFGGVRRLAVAGRGRHVALLHSDHITVHKWPRRTLVSRFAVSGRDTFGIDLDARGTLLAAGLRDGSVRVWRTSSGKRVAELRGHDVRVADVDFHAGTGLLLSASWDGSVRLWDVPTLTAPTAPIARRVRASWGLNMTQALARLHPL